VPDVLVNAFQVEFVVVLTQIINGLHPESVLQHLLSCEEEDIFVAVRKVEWLRQDPEELWLLEGHTQPFVDN
jgi:hypothetical protein